jgi:hypothetical protein
VPANAANGSTPLMTLLPRHYHANHKALSDQIGRRFHFMPRDRAIIFRDLVGKLDVVNIECAKALAEANTTLIG